MSSLAFSELSGLTILITSFDSSLGVSLALPKGDFADELSSESLSEWVLQFREWEFIHERRGERTLQMWICFYLIQKFFFQHGYSFRPIIIEERATEGDSHLGDIVLPSQTTPSRIDVWVEIKNHFGLSSLTGTQMKKLRKDFEKCQANIDNGGIGVVILTMDWLGDAEASTQDLRDEFGDVRVALIGGVR